MIKNYLFYASPALPLALLGLPLYVYLPTYYAQDLQLGVMEVGIVLLLARILDMITDPLIGYVSDRYLSRKIFMFLGSFLLLSAFYFLTHPGQNASIFSLFIFSMIVYLGWSFISIPYYAIGSDIGRNYKENTSYASYREFFNISGVLLALVIPYMYKVSEDAEKSLQLLNNVILLVLPTVILIFFITVKTKMDSKSYNSITQIYSSIINKVKTSKYLFSAFFLNNFANALPSTLFLLYVELVLVSKEHSGSLLLIYFISGVVALPFWYFLANKISKKTTWILSMINAIVFFSFVPFLGAGDYEYFLFITIFSGMSLGADMALPASMQADLIQKQNSSKIQVGGALFGIFAMITKLSLAIAVGVSFFILGLFDFIPENPTKEGLIVLSLLYGALPVVLKILAIFTLLRFSEKTNDQLT